MRSDIKVKVVSKLHASHQSLISTTLRQVYIGPHARASPNFLLLRKPGLRLSWLGTRMVYTVAAVPWVVAAGGARGLITAGLARDRPTIGRSKFGPARSSGLSYHRGYSKENMSFQRIFLCSAALLFVSTDAFSISATTKLQAVQRSSVQLRSSAPRRSDFSFSMQAGSDNMDRRSAIVAAAALFAGVASPLKNANAAGLAFGYGANENDINSQLLAYSMPPIDKVVAAPVNRTDHLPVIR
jgi:hypothetical protein